MAGKILSCCRCQRREWTCTWHCNSTYQKHQQFNYNCTRYPMNICKAPECLANAASVSVGWPCWTTVWHATPAASKAAAAGANIACFARSSSSSRRWCRSANSSGVWKLNGDHSITCAIVIELLVFLVSAIAVLSARSLPSLASTATKNFSCHI